MKIRISKFVNDYKRFLLLLKKRESELSPLVKSNLVISPSINLLNTRFHSSKKRISYVQRKRKINL